MVLQTQIEYVISPPGQIFDRLRAICEVMQMTPGVGDGVGLGELDGELVGLPDGCVLGVPLGVDDVVLCDGVGVSDGICGVESPGIDGLPVWAPLAWLSSTAENTAADPAAQGEWENLACRAGTTDTASAVGNAEPDNKNIPPAIKTATRPARAILMGTAALR